MEAKSDWNGRQTHGDGDVTIYDRSSQTRLELPLPHKVTTQWHSHVSSHTSSSIKVVSWVFFFGFFLRISSKTQPLFGIIYPWQWPLGIHRRATSLCFQSPAQLDFSIKPKKSCSSLSLYINTNLSEKNIIYNLQALAVCYSYMNIWYSLPPSCTAQFKLNSQHCRGNKRPEVKFSFFLNKCSTGVNRLMLL